MYQSLNDYCRQLEREFESIPHERRQTLAKLGEYVTQKLSGDAREAQLMAICTHNSRRSHIAQLWLAIGADFYGLPHLRTYSAGTEVTAFNSRAVDAARRCGLAVQAADPLVENPIYRVSWKTDMPAYLAFSKRIDDPVNPTQSFAAIMVCSQADAGCPFVPGADLRTSLPYDDPKASDGTPAETETYDARLRQIGREMLFALSLVKIDS